MKYSYKNSFKHKKNINIISIYSYFYSNPY